MFLEIRLVSPLYTSAECKGRGVGFRSRLQNVKGLDRGIFPGTLKSVVSALQGVLVPFYRFFMGKNRVYGERLIFFAFSRFRSAALVIRRREVGFCR